MNRSIEIGYFDSNLSKVSQNRYLSLAFLCSYFPVPTGAIGPSAKLPLSEKCDISPATTKGRKYVRTTK